MSSFILEILYQIQRTKERGSSKLKRYHVKLKKILGKEVEIFGNS